MRRTSVQVFDIGLGVVALLGIVAVGYLAHWFATHDCAETRVEVVTRCTTVASGVVDCRPFEEYTCSRWVERGARR